MDSRNDCAMSWLMIESDAAARPLKVEVTSVQHSHQIKSFTRCHWGRRCGGLWRPASRRSNPGPGARVLLPPKVVLICNNLKTHGIASLYETFPPEVARALARRMELRHMPKHGSWLNIAACELSVLTRQRLSGRTPNLKVLKKKTRA